LSCSLGFCVSDGGDFKQPNSSPPKSPRKRLVSPIKVTRNHPIKSFARNSSKSPSPKRSNFFQSPQRSPARSPIQGSPARSPSSSPSAKKKLPFTLSPSKGNSPLKAESSSGAEGKYYFESFYHIVEVCIQP